MNFPKPPQLCKEINERGQGVGVTPQGHPLFASNWLPGEYAHLIDKHQVPTYVQGSVLKLLNESPDRVKPACRAFPECGGCQLQHMSYPAQLALKKERLRQQLGSRGLDLPVGDVVASSPHYYRHKLLLPVRRVKGHVQVGFYSGGNNQLVPIASSDPDFSAAKNPCIVQTPALNQLIELLPDSLQIHGVALGDHRGEWDPQIPTLRLVLARQSLDTPTIHLTLIVSSSGGPWQALTRYLAEKLQVEVTGASLLINASTDNRLLRGQREPLWGEPVLNEKLLGMPFTYDPLSFFQVNPAVAEQIWRQIHVWLIDSTLDDSGVVESRLPKSSSLLELYCGSGLMANWLALQGMTTYGIERDYKAIATAQQLASQLHTGAHFQVHDLDRPLPPLDFQPTTLMVNPPRKGLPSHLFRAIEQLKTPRFIYMACGQEALVRDLIELKKIGYTPHTLIPYDLFPQTTHIETLTLLRRVQS